MENQLVSIAVPCYEMHGNGSVYLNKLLKSIKLQTYKKVQIVISDHSQDSVIEDMIDSFNDLNIKYIKNVTGRGSSSINVNTAISNCDGDVIIPLFQDDFLYSPHYLRRIVNEFLPSSSKWGASACNHTDANETGFFNNHPATYEGFDVTGINTIGAPSVIFFKKECAELFDEKLIWLMDCEFYYRLHKNYGLPYLFNDEIMVTVRIWESNVSNTLATKDIRKKEAQYVLTKHDL